ncbi:hypothetical protein [Streptomyces sp. HNM0574]|uniref:hypothetical protein n=1 Tax=Streptomyces sp. HNM0574 TaxID=2714954 RepID=UPI00146C790F|nr:hypothetical protein [Streptomyces sp. HNM0574]NLU70054.1 hypothetical protein [Streptomyces sp. HNM0574]
MSSSPQHSDEQPQHGHSRQDADAPRPGAALVFDDPLSLPSSDDTDRGWGEGASSSGGNSGAADLARFLDEKPPHHL